MLIFVDYCVNCCTTERCCQMNFIHSYARLLLHVRVPLRSRRRAGCWLATWTDSLLENFKPIVENLHPSKYCSMTLAASPHTACSRHTLLLPEPRGPLISIATYHFPRQRTTDWRSSLQKRNLLHSLLLHIVCTFNYPCPVTHAILECLNMPLYTFQQRVSIIYIVIL
jgi:hypothetical protein